MAVRKTLKKMETKEILSRLNQVYSETESSEEATLRERSKKYFSKKILKEESSCRHIKK